MPASAAMRRQRPSEREQLDLFRAIPGELAARDGGEIALKPMEFDLLVMLAKNKNIALSRERLLHGVWGVDYQGETRTVDVHIAQIRKKLGLEEQIKTISKLGYRLED